MRASVGGQGTMTEGSCLSLFRRRRGWWDGSSGGGKPRSGIWTEHKSSLAAGFVGIRPLDPMLPLDTRVSRTSVPVLGLRLRPDLERAKIGHMLYSGFSNAGTLSKLDWNESWVSSLGQMAEHIVTACEHSNETWMEGREKSSKRRQGNTCRQIRRAWGGGGLELIVPWSQM